MYSSFPDKPNCFLVYLLHEVTVRIQQSKRVKTLLNIHDSEPDGVQARIFGGRRGGLGDHKIFLLIY